MLISMKRKFIVLSPPKVASSSVINFLAPHCDVKIDETVFGKHDQIQTLVERYSYFSRGAIGGFKIFILFRHPIDRLFSLYKYHTRDAFRDRPLYTRDMSIDTFVGSWITQELWQALPQFLYGVLSERGFVADFLIRTDQLVQDLPAALSLVDLAVDVKRLPQHNKSPVLPNEADLKEELERKVKHLYEVDQLLYDEYAGTTLDQGQKDHISTYIAQHYHRQIDLATLKRQVKVQFSYRSPQSQAQTNSRNCE